MSEQEKIAQRYARQLSAEHHVDAALYSEAEHAFGQRGLVEITYLTGIYHAVCGLLNAFEIPARPSRGSVGGFGSSSLENDHADETYATG